MEAEQDPKTITLGGQLFTLPVELPFMVADLWRIGEVAQGLQMLLGDQWVDFTAKMPSTLDLEELVAAISPMYGFGDPGESLGSGSSSANGSKPSKRTSSASTG